MNGRHLLPRSRLFRSVRLLLPGWLLLFLALPAQAQDSEPSTPAERSTPDEALVEGTAEDDPAAETAVRETDEADRPPRWFSRATSFTPLLAASRETRIGGTFILAERRQPDGSGGTESAAGGSPFVGGDFEGTNLEAEVALGHRLPIVILRNGTDGGPLIALELDVGIFSRFFMETRQKDLINTDYRVGVPVGAVWGPWEGRLDLRHISSHAGDEFIRRFGVADRQVSLDGFELLVARRVADGVRAYGGGEWNFRATSFVETWAARGGLEIDSGWNDPERRFWPFAAVDLRINNERERLEGTAATGVALRIRSLSFRLEARGHLGPSPMGWLRTSDETFWGVGLRVEPVRGI